MLDEKSHVDRAVERIVAQEMRERRRRREVVDRANRACRGAGIDNVHNVFANMSVDLPHLFAATKTPSATMLAALPSVPVRKSSAALVARLRKARRGIFKSLSTVMT